MATATAETHLNTQKLPGHVDLAVAAGVILLGHLPLVVLHFRSLWQQEQYQYFPFVIGAVVWLLWTRMQEGRQRPAQPSRLASLPWWILTAGLLLLATAIVLISPWLAYVALIVSLTAVFVWIGRVRQVEYLWGIWLLLWLMVPPPLGQDERLVRWLQRLSSQLSSTILDFIGVLHMMAGNVLQLPKKEFFVDEACSGIVSVMSVIACAAIYSVWRNRSLVHLVLLALAGIVWALVLNVVRITSIAIAFHFYDVDLSSGAVHETLGLVLFLLVFLALVSTDFLLMALLAPIDSRMLGEASDRNWLVQWWNRFIAAGGEGLEEDLAETGLEPTPAFGWGKVAVVAVPCVLLVAMQFVRTPSVDTAQAEQALERALALDENGLPERLGPWVRESFDTVERESKSDFGRYSRSYVYRMADHPTVTATVSLDFPYLGGWHDLCMCYRLTGWEIAQRATESAPGPVGGDWDFICARLKSESQENARVMYSGFDAAGELAEPPTDAVLFRPWFRLRRRLLINLAPQLYQVQVFAPVGSFANEQLEAELKKLLLDASKHFRAEVVGQMAAGG